MTFSRERRVLGIDASRAVTDAPTGTEYYSRALIQALLKLDSGFWFRLYARRAPPPNFFPSTDNYEIRSMPFPRLWTHLRLSYEMLERSPNALFVPAHVLPPIHPHNSLVTVHDLGYKFFPGAHPLLARLYLEWSTQYNVRAARVIIADSYATRDDIERFYGAGQGAGRKSVSAKIRVVYPSYNAGVFKPVPPDEIERVRAGYNVTLPYIISVGTIQPRKNYARLVEAFAALPAGYSLVIVGKKGWRYEPVLADVQKRNLTRRVKFIEYAPIEDLPALYAGARLAVFPSLYEGFGFPALEAQACGTPLVCSNTSSLPEVAGAGAVYFDPLRADEMTRAMLAVLQEEPLRQTLIEQGPENVKRFSWERAARQVSEIVRTL